MLEGKSEKKKKQKESSRLAKVLCMRKWKGR